MRLHTQLPTHYTEEFENVMQGIYFDATAKLLSKMSVATSASVKLTLKKTVALSRDKLSSLMAADPGK
ncbi:hypothetical protein PR048_010943 [Dryococelus australis]|uniref:Uncharacterized protein n=1 Tax=Dryococelus australis TaxID=614101 RepID=A0ABQ9HKA3_9NEOP|nr:hypothetical protein PR048_010943 [Dryococelus australis]